jgi:hypothetical protein
MYARWQGLVTIGEFLRTFHEQLEAEDREAEAGGTPMKVGARRGGGGHEHALTGRESPSVEEAAAATTTVPQKRIVELREELNASLPERGGGGGGAGRAAADGSLTKVQVGFGRTPKPLPGVTLGRQATAWHVALIRLPRF